MGRPSASTPICLPVRSALKSPALKASMGVVLPKPSRVPERNRVQSALTKKNVLFLMMGPPSGDPPVLVVQRGLGQLEEALGVEGVLGQVAVGAGVEPVGARLGRVLDEAAARVTVLGRIGRGDDRDLLDGFHRRCALLAALVPGGVTERAAVEEVLGGPRLAAVDAGVELAPAEHRVAVRRHGQVAGLHQEHRLGQADVGGGDDREVVVVLLVHAVARRRAGSRRAHPPPTTSTDSAISPIWSDDIVADHVSGSEQDPRGRRLS